MVYSWQLCWDPLKNIRLKLPLLVGLCIPYCKHINAWSNRGVPKTIQNDFYNKEEIKSAALNAVWKYFSWFVLTLECRTMCCKALLVIISHPAAKRRFLLVKQLYKCKPAGSSLAWWTVKSPGGIRTPPTCRINSEYEYFFSKASRKSMYEYMKNEPRN